MSGKPLSVDQALIRARSHTKRGDLQQARHLYRSILDRFPGNQRAIDGLNALHRALPETLSEEQANALVELFSKHRVREALSQAEALLAIYPNAPFLHNFLGVIHASQGRRQEALQAYGRAVELKPDYAEAHNNLGLFLKENGEYRTATTCYLNAIALNPQYTEAHNNLGVLLEAIEEPAAAADSYRKAIAIKPDYPDAHYNLANALRDMGRHDEAIESYKTALKLRPGFAQALNNLGVALRHIGRRGEAVASYEAAIAIKPDLASAYRNLSTIRKFTPHDPMVARMEDLLAGTTVPSNRQSYSFALGKAYDDIGDIDKAFRHYTQGNRLRKEELGYDINRDIARFALIKRLFSTEAVEHLSGADFPQATPRPVFIVGMPRSGTTLTEQILASHSHVFGAGELRYLSQIVTPVVNAMADRAEPKLEASVLSTIRQAYLGEIAKFDTDAPVLTDKMPLNFTSIGFILTAFPEAKIVNLCRDPVATCWSIFTHHFTSSGNGFAYDLGDVSAFYNLYADLMAFWRERFPGRIYDLGYEALTENQEEETRRLLAYCGLDWEDACLDFHKTERAVRTASASQVRDRIYKGSSRSWRRFEAHLQPLIEALKAGPNPAPK